MPLDRIAVYLIAFALIAYSHVDEEVQLSLPTKSGGDNSCCADDIEDSAKEFLEDVLTGDMDRIRPYFHSEMAIADLNGQIAYIFFPNHDSSAIFDIIGKNEESEFVSYVLGDYERGQLVGYVQKIHQDRITDVEFLKTKKFESFFVCHFVCQNGKWMLSTKTCFEETDNPFGF